MLSHVEVRCKTVRFVLLVKRLMTKVLCNASKNVWFVMKDLSKVLWVVATQSMINLLVFHVHMTICGDVLSAESIIVSMLMVINTLSMFASLVKLDGHSWILTSVRTSRREQVDIAWVERLTTVTLKRWKTSTPRETHLNQSRECSCSQMVNVWITAQQDLWRTQ